MRMFETIIASEARDRILLPPGAGRFEACIHDRAARAAALDDGLLSEEVDEVLGGRRIVDAFPVRRGESPPAYAVRAVAEMMVAYLR
ncbi:hypothetical protein MTDSW087_03852 [Methylobacterium dankookense]|uniref:Uncharacterized protein n=2 Tax=Methylobacterium dankookense TaxID=560405 RepID=A0A564G1M3_9HYPH|nr:hypothetical protein IFDJLNFL_1744 [Methylobacterium dankookense]VUF14137.1 hypothetical protein MTDSW087_03852 [Methylobacterium dankookense]